MKPSVSIIVPTYNRAHFIAETLKCIENQSFKKWECLIIDDGSTDNTRELLKPFLEKDQRFKFYSRSKIHLKGPSGCRNQGIELSKGENIIFFDSDDVIHPDNLKICIDILNQYPELSYCRYEKQAFKGEWLNKSFENKDNFKVAVIDLKDIAPIVTNKLPFACCTVMWRRKALGAMRFDEKLSYAEEWEYYIRLLSEGIRGASLNTVLYYHRKHPKSNTGEFWAHHKIRRDSNISAILKSMETLKIKRLLTERLTKYFIRLGFFLDSRQVLQKALSYSAKGMIFKFKYQAGFYLYPVIRPILRLKGKLFKK